jgi:hypothetical protein
VKFFMLGYTSQVVNGQLVNVAPGQAYNPLTFGAQYTGPAMWTVGSPYNVPPVLPSPVGASGVTQYSPDMGGSRYGGGAPMPTAGSVRDDGTVNWWHPTKSPVLWAIGFLMVSLVLLHKVHFR